MAAQMAAEEMGRHQHPHPEGLEHSGPLDKITHRRRGGADGGRPPGREGHAGKNGHQGRDQNVDLGLLGDCLAQLSGNDRDKQHC